MPNPYDILYTTSYHIILCYIVSYIIIYCIICYIVLYYFISYYIYIYSGGYMGKRLFEIEETDWSRVGHGGIHHMIYTYIYNI